MDTTSTSGVSVTVNSRPAPLIYVSENQISIQIPYEAVIGPSNVVAVTNGFNPPVTATVTVAATAPGLFTADGSGTGQAAALNYNAVTKLYTLNSSTNLAKIGDTVILYLTGEGVFDSAPLLGGGSDTGFVIPPGLPSTPQVNPLPTVMIGGVDASAGVAYAGPIVSSIIGVSTNQRGGSGWKHYWNPGAGQRNDRRKSDSSRHYFGDPSVSKSSVSKSSVARRVTGP